MASKTVALKNNNGDQIHPKTKANAVFLEDGQSVESKFKTIGDGFSGSYDDLTGKPELFSGSYNDLTNKPDSSKISYNNDLSSLEADNVQNAIDEIISLKAEKNGFATLDSSGKVPSTQLPSMNYIPTSQKGIANGVATLDNNKKLMESQLPNIYTVTKFDSVEVEADAFSNLDVDAFACGKLVFLNISGVTTKLSGSSLTITITSPNIPSPIPDVLFPGILRFIVTSNSEGTLWTEPFGAVHTTIRKSHLNTPRIDIDISLSSPDYPYADVRGGLMYISE